MKFGAIDIGSNAVRLYIARPLEIDSVHTPFKGVEFTRLPLRLGDDVFRSKVISKRKSDLLVKAMRAFMLLMEIYNVDAYRACATSAMRDAGNGKKLVRDIKRLTGLKIDIVTGKEESRLVQRAVMERLPGPGNFLHIDVGGGSTEISFIKNGKIKHYESFNVGTVRMREGKIKPSEIQRMHHWLEQLPIYTSESLKAIGTGGNIVKLHQLSGCKESEGLNLHHLKATVSYIQTLSHHDRVYELKLNPDRAEVIDFAGQIFTEIMHTCSIHDIYAPNIGLKDGMVRELWDQYQKSRQIL